MIHRMRAWATARRQAREEEALSKLRESLDELGLSQPIPESVEGALRQTARSEWVTVSLSILSLLATWIWIGWMFAFTWQVGREVASFGDGISVPAWGKVVDAVDRTEPFKVGMLIPMFGGAIAVSIGILIAIPVGLFVFSRMIGGTPSRVARAMGMEVTYLPFAAALAVRNMVEIANSCAEAGRASGEARVQSVAGIPAASASSKRAIMRASRHRAFWWPFSHHGAVLREHAALVLGRIQQAEERLYRDPQPALRELALMWLTVSERYGDIAVSAEGSTAYRRGMQKSSPRLALVAAGV
ncbi:hypothetical protein ACWDNT_10140, partial [Streptomyces sp. NPDC000963]